MNCLPNNHPERFALAEEVHARPSEMLATPSRASYLALRVEPEDRSRETAHLARLCQRFGLPAPASDITHFSAALAGLRLKWERHGEFSSWTVVAAGRESQAFAQPALTLLPEGWLRELPGLTLVAAHAVVSDALASGADGAGTAGCFEDHLVVGARRSSRAWRPS